MTPEPGTARPRARGFRRLASAIAPHPALVFFSAMLATVCVIAVLVVFVHGVFAVLSMILGVVNMWYASTFSHGRLARGPVYKAHTLESERRRAVVVSWLFSLTLVIFGVWLLIDDGLFQNLFLRTLNVTLFEYATLWVLLYIWGEVIAPARPPLPTRE